MKIIEETPYRFRIEQEGAMRVPGIVFASRSLLPDEHGDMALTQVANVATLQGIVRASFAMPDVHWGYGFPIGGVAATDIDAQGVVSPGGVGFDISCGVRLLVSRDLDRDRLQPWIAMVMDRLDDAIPRGVGNHQRNAKLQLTVVLAPPEVVPGLYLHPDHRRRRRRPVVRSQLDV